MKCDDKCTLTVDVRRAELCSSGEQRLDGGHPAVGGRDHQPEEPQGKGAVSAAKAVEPHGRGGVLRVPAVRRQRFVHHPPACEGSGGVGRGERHRDASLWTCDASAT